MSGVLPPRIELIARRSQDLQGGYADYQIYAGEQLVGRIYERQAIAGRELWFWGLHTITLDMTVGAPMHGYAEGFVDARTKLRAAFDRWLEWALAMPRGDMKYLRISAELKKMDTA